MVACWLHCSVPAAGPGFSVASVGVLVAPCCVTSWSLLLQGLRKRSDHLAAQKLEAQQELAQLKSCCRSKQAEQDGLQQQIKVSLEPYSSSCLPALLLSAGVQLSKQCPKQSLKQLHVPELLKAGP